MQRYKNLGGDSGVYAYELGNGSITVQFNDGTTYLYTIASAGSYNITQMQYLAKAGKGLNSFISTTVKKRYAAKLR